MSDVRTYLVAYDIRSPWRLHRVSKALTEVGYRLQYSVFVADLSDDMRRDLVDRLKKILNQKEDDLRLYLVPPEPRGGWQGTLPGSEGILVTGSPAATLTERLAAQRIGERKRG